jgi:LDH2 family malate/lactate/ureidoglycolate dehydrogenase
MTTKLYQQFVTALKRHGLSKREANLVLDEYGSAKNLTALAGVLERLKRRGGPVKVISNRGATMFLEGNKELGQIAADEAVKLASAKAKKYGVGMVGLRNILSFNHPGTYAKKLADKNLFGLVMIDGGRAMVAHPDSSEPVIGTNPLAFALPTSRGLWVVDMATSKHAWATVRRALAQGVTLPPEAYKDKGGKFTRDPKKAFSALPFGDYKGFALGMLVEILCGSLLGMTMGKRKKSSNHLATSRGAVFMAIDLQRFVSVNKFKHDTTKFLREIKTSKPNKGVKLIRVPGELSLKSKL